MAANGSSQMPGRALGIQEASSLSERKRKGWIEKRMEEGRETYCLTILWGANPGSGFTSDRGLYQKGDQLPAFSSYKCLYGDSHRYTVQSMHNNAQICTYVNSTHNNLYCTFKGSSPGSFLKINACTVIHMKPFPYIKHNV